MCTNVSRVLTYFKAFHVCFYVFWANTVSCAADQNRVIYNLYIFSTGNLHVDVQEPTDGETASED